MGLKLDNFYFVLDGHDVVPAASMLEASMFLKMSSLRRVARFKIFGTMVSTVFLPINHNFGRFDPENLPEIDDGVERRPIVFETMVFGGRYDGECCRYCTWDEAVRGHWKMVWKIVSDPLIRIGVMLAVAAVLALGICMAR